MKRIMIKAIGLLIGFCASSAVQAQDRCGTKTPAIPYRVDSAMMAQSRVLYTSPLLMKVFVHIVANDNGSNRAVADTTVMRQLVNMMQFYAPQDICFVLMGIEQINSTDLNTQDADNEEGEITPHVIAGVMNIFVHQTLFDNKGSLNGNAYGIPNNYLSVIASAVESIDNRSTIAHEMGHCFGLYHTFEKNYGEENIDRSGQCTNCIFAGDLLCDTEADPHSDTYETANHIDGSCVYHDPFLFQYCAGDKLFYDMDPHNIMAYGVRSCRDIFTNGQGSRARSIITTSPILFSSIAPDNNDVTSVVSINSGRPMYAARTAVVINSPSFTISGSARANFSSNTQVIFKPGAVLNPSGIGYSEARVSTLCQ